MRSVTFNSCCNSGLEKLPKPVARKSTAGGNNAAAQRSSSDDSSLVVMPRNVARPTGIPNSSFLEFEGKMAVRFVNEMLSHV